MGNHLLARLLVVAFFVFTPSPKADIHKLSDFKSSFTLYGQSRQQANQSTDVATKINLATEEYLGKLHTQFNLSSNSTFQEEAPVRLDKNYCRRFDQVLEGREIIGAYAMLCFSPSGDTTESREGLCDGECIQNAESPSPQSLSVPGLLAELATRVGKGFGRIVAEKTLYDEIWMEDPKQQGLLLGWKVDVETTSPYGRYRAYSDQVGNLLTYEDLVHTVETIGRVYEISPYRSKPEEKKLVQLDVISNLSSQTLRFFVISEDPPRNASPNDNGKYLFRTNDTRFDHVQAYYGAQLITMFLGNLGYHPTKVIPLEVHVGENYPNAFYDGRRLAFGDGDFGLNGNRGVMKDPAKDNGVIAHEYGHFVIDTHADFRSIPGEDGPIFHEGHADYIACALANHPELGRGVTIRGEPLRTCNSGKKFLEREKEPHADGEIWSGALWEVRTKLGGAVLDKLALHMLPRIQAKGWLGNLRLQDAYEALLATEKILYLGQYQNAIRSIFEKREFPKSNGAIAQKLD